MSVKNFKDILLFDGAMGTYFSKVYHNPLYKCEYANITEPEIIKKIHTEYLTAGANAIKTNTFSLEQNSEFSKEEIITSAYKIATNCAKNFDAFVFADIGYIPTENNKNKFEEYKEIVDIFINLGAKNFIFETLSDDIGISEISHYIKETIENSYIITSFAVNSEGITSTGQFYEQLFYKYTKNDDVDAVGFNCVCGPLHLSKLIENLVLKDKPVSIMPNSSYPTIVGNRTTYGDNPQYFASKMLEIAEKSVKILGGCCGTTPEFIQSISNLLKNSDISKTKHTPQKKETSQKESRENTFLNKLLSGEKPIAVELDSPLAPDIKNFIKNASFLNEKGADLITIADCPVARARMDSSLLACKLKREYSIEVMPHMTCRDRNLNASKALLLGLNAEEVNNVLIVTGDPVPTTFRNEVKTVFQFNSRLLISHITHLNETLFTSPFSLYSALNLNAKNFEIQLKLAKEKIANGAVGFFSQPVHSKNALENLKRAKSELNAPIMVGILPIISHKNAVFMNNEVPGITISDELTNEFLDKTKEECKEITLRTSKEIINQVYDYADGFYLITLFGRTDIIENLIEYIKSK